ncbi:MAG: helix-turn-helix transcriptional regulator [Litorimonas sp.]
MSTHNTQNDDQMLIATRLREARDYVGLRQDHVAEDLKVSRSAISEIESGRRKVSAVELKALAKLYQRPVSWFTDDIVGEVSKEVEFLARTATELSDRDLNELQQFAEFLKNRSEASDE